MKALAHGKRPTVRKDLTVVTSYAYDGDGQRVKKDESGGSTYDKLYWRGLSGEVLLETELDGDLIREFIYFGGQRIARRDADGNVYYLFPDRLGSVRVMTNATGTTAWAATYLPFGDTQRVIVDTVNNLYRFADMEYDTESGVYNTLFRKYSPNLGRWLGADPMAGDVGNPQSLNRYGYVVNNPTNLIDPSGACYLYDYEYFDAVNQMQVFHVDTGPCPPDSSVFSWIWGRVSSMPWDWGVTGHGSGGGGGGGGGGGIQTQSEPVTTQLTPPAKQAAIDQCVKDFYNSKAGKVVQFADPLSLLPAWNPDWKESMASWAEVLVPKAGALTYATTGEEIWSVTRGTAKIIASRPERAVKWGLDVAKQFVKPAMGAAALTDVFAHFACWAQQYPDAAAALMNSAQ